MQNDYSESIESKLLEELEYNRTHGISLINHMKESKEFQNPKIIQKTIDYFKIDGNGTQFDPVCLLLAFIEYFLFYRVFTNLLRISLLCNICCSI